MGRKQDNDITSGLHYGNWCGPGWSAKQAKDSAELTYADFDVPAIDALDQACKNHDIGLRLAETREDVERVNGEFVREATRAGILGTAFAFLVKNLGPTEPGMSFSNLPCPSENKKAAGKTIKNGVVYNNATRNMNKWKNYDKNNVQINSQKQETLLTRISQRLLLDGQYQKIYLLTHQLNEK